MKLLLYPKDGRNKLKIHLLEVDYLTGFQEEDSNFRNPGPAKHRVSPTKRAFNFTFWPDINFLVFSNNK